VFLLFKQEEPQGLEDSGRKTAHLLLFWGWGHQGALFHYGVPEQVIELPDLELQGTFEVCFLFLVSLWRRTVLKLVTNGEFKPWVLPGQLQQTCVLCLLPVLALLFCSWQFGDFGKREAIWIRIQCFIPHLHPPTPKMWSINISEPADCCILTPLQVPGSGDPQMSKTWSCCKTHQGL
jgi:hypothetical protein